MRAIVISRPGGPEVLDVRDVPRPDPGEHEIRVRVHATAINRADLLQRRGGYPAPPGSPADIPGLEYAGVVDDVGVAVTRWRAGDRVMGLVGGGSYAEYIVTHEDEAVRVPDGMSFEDAAAVPEAFITAHDAMFTQMRLQRGETVLIHAVGSGVGTAALQLALACGADVIGTQRSAWKLERARELGLVHGIDTSAGPRRAGPQLTAPDAPGSASAAQAESADARVAHAGVFADEVLRLTSGAGVDGVLDLVGGDYLPANVQVLKTKGRILLVGLVAGARCELDLRRVLQKRATIIGTVLRARPLAEKIEVARAFESDVLPLLESRAVRPVVDEVLPLDEAARAHEIVESNRNFGKIVLAVR